MTESVPGIWVTDPDAYRKKLSDLLGDRDPLTVLARMPDVVRDVVRANSIDVLRTRPFEGKWTPNEIIGHLVDTEWIFGYRIRLIYGEDQPTILGMDHELWVTRQKYNDREPVELAESFRNLREVNLRLWESMTPSDLARAGLHNERGAETLGTLRTMLAGHDLWHIDQIHRYVQAVMESA